jgi:4-nitrophenyl phosphatase
MELDKVHALLIDLDGVLYRGRAPLPGASELFDFLREHKISYLLVTNNSTLTREAFVERLAGFDIHVTPNEIMTSAVATAAYLRTLAPAGTKVNVVGESGLVHELERFGFVMAGRDAEYVVAGWDKTVTYEKLRVATLAIRDGATFVGTNPDKTYPMENDIIPGAGSILAALVAATDVEPIIVGKPEPIIIQRCLELIGTTPEETAMLGDRLDTDILGGQRAGTGTILVLTGISTREEAAAWQPQPDLIVTDLTELIRQWESALPGES